MTTDLECCREILRALEAHSGRDGIDLAGRITDDSHHLARQIALLEQAGLVRCPARADDDAPGSVVDGFTPRGREFLRLAKNDTLWKRALGELSSGGGDVTLRRVNARLLEWAQFS